MSYPERSQSLMKGRCEILEPLHSRGSGKVFRGVLHSPKGELQVVVRVVEHGKQVSRSPRLREELQAQAKAMIALEHPGLGRVFALDLFDDRFVLVEEGMSEASLAMMRQSYSPIEVAEVGVRLAAALATVHEKGFGHGAVRPSHIYFRDGTPSSSVLSGLGVAAIAPALGIDNADETSSIAPMWFYAPPEAFGYLKGGGFETSDLYSLGVVLYEMATGERLFAATDIRKLVSIVYSDAPMPLHERIKNFPEPLSEIISRLLRKSPGQRYQTALGLHRDLAACLKSLREKQPLQIFALGRADKRRDLISRVSFIGRKKEMETMSLALFRALTKSSECLTIGAVSGTGKTRIAQETLLLAECQGCQVFSTKYSKFERNIPLNGLIRILRAHTVWLATLGGEVLEPWRAKLTSELGCWGRLIASRFPFYNDLLPQFPKIPSTLRIEEEERYFFEALARFLIRLDPLHQGLVVFLDDLQWADSSSFEVLEYLVKELSKDDTPKGTLFLGVYRSEEVPDDHPLALKVLPQLEPGQRTDLGPLSQEECNEYVHALIDETGEESDKLAAFAYRATGGTPFHVYECLKNSLSEGIFRRQEGETWTFDAERADKAGVNQNVLSLVSERIKKLSLPSRIVILTLAPLASSFSTSAVAHLLQQQIVRAGEAAREWLPGIEISPDSLLMAALDELVEKDLIAQREQNIAFVHDRVREAAISLVDEKEKILSHTDYAWFSADELSERGEEADSRDVFEAAFHFLKGNLEAFPDKARRVLLDAGRRGIKVFAFQRAEEYLAAARRLLPETPETLESSPAQFQEWLAIMELHADALTLCEKIREAIKIYQETLNWQKDPVQRAFIYSKLVDNHQYLFNYQDAMYAGAAGLRELDTYFPMTERAAIIRLPFYAVQLILAFIWFTLFGKRTKEISSHADETKWRLMTSIQVPIYFSRPICAAINQFPLTWRSLAYKDNEYRALVTAYWGVVFSGLGIPRLARWAFAKAGSYFDAHPSPVRQIFLMFVWGYLLDFPNGNLEGARAKLLQSLHHATELGESFWRSCCLQAIILCDRWGIGSGDSDWGCVEVWRIEDSIVTEVSPGSVCLKEFLFRGELLDLERRKKKVSEDLQRQLSLKTGLSTTYAGYMLSSLGELSLLQGEPEMALPKLEFSYRLCLLHMNRIAYCLGGVPLLASAYVRSKRPLKAISPLLFSWFNVFFLFVPVIRPATMCATAEFLYAMGLHHLAFRMMRSTIDWTSKRRWRPTTAEAQLLLGKLVFSDTSSATSTDLAWATEEVRLAREFFEERRNTFYAKQCDDILALAKDHYAARSAPLLSAKEISLHGSAIIPTIRDKIDMAAMLDMFAKLSVLRNLDDLLDVVLETFCVCSGANAALAFMPIDGKWQIRRSRNIAQDPQLEKVSLAGYVDAEFLEKALSAELSQPIIRESNAEKGEGSAMLVPLLEESQVLCAVYLENKQMANLFSEQTHRVIMPLAHQASIGLRNITLMEGREDKVRLEAELETARAVQSSILPFSEPPSNVRIAGHYKPAEQTGGDWYGYFYDKGSDTMFIFIGDATGHGVASALVAGLMCGAIYGNLFLQESEIESGCSSDVHSTPERLRNIVNACNACLHSTGARSDVLMTMFHIAVNLTSGKCWAVSSGHNHPFHLHRSQQTVNTIAQSGMRLGYAPPNEHVARVCELQLIPGDLLFLYTDGLVENMGPDGKMVSMRELKQLLTTPMSADETVQSVLKMAHDVWQNNPPADDVSLLAFEWTGQQRC